MTSIQNTGYPQPNPEYPPYPNSGYPPQPSPGYPLSPNSGYPQQPNSGYPQQPNSGYPPKPMPNYPQQQPPPYAEAYPPQTNPPPYISNVPSNSEDDIKFNDDASMFQNAFSEKNIRMAFIRKVYLILMCQLLVSVAFIALFIFHRGVKDFVRKNTAFYWSSYGVFLITYFTIVCCKDVRRKFPTNFVLLAIFTLAMSFMLGTISSFYDTQTVFIAIGLCALVCLGITLFAIQTKIDFTVCHGLLFVLVLILLIFGICVAIWPSKVSVLGYSCLGAFVFSLYLIYDTQMLMGGRKYQLSPEEYIFAALEIYMDIAQIFLYILLAAGSKK